MGLTYKQNWAHCETHSWRGQLLVLTAKPSNGGIKVKTLFGGKRFI